MALYTSSPSDASSSFGSTLWMMGLHGLATPDNGNDTLHKLAQDSAQPGSNTLNLRFDPYNMPASLFLHEDPDGIEAAPITA